MTTKNKITLISTASIFALGLISFSNLFKTVPETENKMILSQSLSNNKMEQKEKLISINNEPIEILSLDAEKSKSPIVNKPPKNGRLSHYKKKTTISNVFNGLENIKDTKVPLDIDKVLKRKWDVDIGRLSYRSNFELISNYIYVGSNGSNFNDWHLWDENSGVYKINSRNGEVAKRIAYEDFGDVDVNGILYHNGQLFFGNDNDEFICVNQNGEIQWRIPISGDVEHQPTLLEKTNGNLIAFATEVGEIRAVDVEKGNTVWKYYDPNFNGWKDGDNRFVFKLKTHFKSGSKFFEKPAVGDINGDGVVDMLYAGSKIVAINGNNGKVIWEIPYEISSIDGNKTMFLEKYKYNAIIVGKGKNLKILTYAKEISSVSNKATNDPSAEKKGKLLVINKRGKLIKEITLSENKNSGSNYLFENLKIGSEEAAFVSENIIYIYDVKNDSLTKINGFNKQTKITYSWGDYFQYDLSGVVEVCPLVLNTSKGNCRLIKWEYGPQDPSVEEYSRGAIIKLWGVSRNSEFLTLRLGSSSEGPLLVKDVDKDGKKELLVECGGKLICYDLSTLSF